MGLSSSTKKQKNTPIYAKEIEGAAGDITGAYRAQQPKITSITDSLGTLVPGLLDKYQTGDPNVNAAKAYNKRVLDGDFLNSNPFLEQIVSSTGNDVRNQTGAALGTRGLTGGSAMTDIISRNVADASGRLRYNDYNTERGRMDSAVGAAAGLAGASEIPIATILQILESQKAQV